MGKKNIPSIHFFYEAYKEGIPLPHKLKVSLPCQFRPNFQEETCCQFGCIAGQAPAILFLAALVTLKILDQDPATRGASLLMEGIMQLFAEPPELLFPQAMRRTRRQKEPQGHNSASQAATDTTGLSYATAKSRPDTYRQLLGKMPAKSAVYGKENRLRAAKSSGMIQIFSPASYQFEYLLGSNPFFIHAVSQSPHYS